MKPTREFIPMDDYERELWEYENDENYNPEIIPNIEEEKKRYQKIAENTTKEREKLKKISQKSKSYQGW